jgi:hypothetical protein
MAAWRRSSPADLANLTKGVNRLGGQDVQREMPPPRRRRSDGRQQGGARGTGRVSGDGAAHQAREIGSAGASRGGRNRAGVERPDADAPLDLVGQDRPEARGDRPRHQAGVEQPRAEQSSLLLQEADASLDGICAAAFSLEALSRELVSLGAIPRSTMEKWRQQEDRPKAENVALEVLSQTFDAKGLVSIWRDELDWLFEMRDSSVHYEGLFEPPRLHPLGMNVSPTQVAYSAENVTRAVDLLLSILERCRDKPKLPAKQWSQDMRGAITELTDRRGQAE